MKIHTRKHWLLLAAICAAGSAYAKADRSHEELMASLPRHYTRRKLNVGLERPGVRIVLCNRYPPPCDILDPVEGSLQIGVSRGGRTTPINAMSELRGVVNIRNESEALQFVRLRTAPSIWFAWSTEDVEIVTEADYRRLPNYGYRDSWAKGTGDGWLGSLSSRAYAAGRFTPAVVRREADGFRIVRWLYTEPYDEHRGSIMKVSEFVGPDGTYRRTILKKGPPIWLPGARLKFPRPE